MTTVLCPSKPAPLDALLEMQPVVLQIEDERFLKRARFKRRARRRHLQARPRFALQLKLQRFDALQRFAATDRRHRSVDDLARPCLRALRERFRVFRREAGVVQSNRTNRSFLHRSPPLDDRSDSSFGAARCARE